MSSLHERELELQPPRENEETGKEGGKEGGRAEEIERKKEKKEKKEKKVGEEKWQSGSCGAECDGWF